MTEAFADGDIPALMTALGQRARAAAAAVAEASPRAKRAALGAAATVLRGRTEELLAANARDLELCCTRGLSAAMTDRSRLDAGRIGGSRAASRRSRRCRIRSAPSKASGRGPMACASDGSAYRSA